LSGWPSSARPTDRCSRAPRGGRCASAARCSWPGSSS
jgi:hypothetical protein